MPPALRHRLPLLPVLAGLVVWPAVVQAQIADVVQPDAQGDFPSVLVNGPRGPYPQRYWLVVDRDPRGLLCRDERGRAWMALRTGAVVVLADEQGQPPPLLIRQSKPYLRVQIKPLDLLQDVRLRDRGKAAVCSVRANTSFLAPIHPDSLRAVLVRP